MDNGEKSAENDEKASELDVKIKDEPQEETIKHYAESTMNELLSIFGYEDKVNSSDTDKLDLKQYTQPRERDGSDVRYEDTVSDNGDSSGDGESASKLKLRLRRPLSNGTSDTDSQNRSLLSVLKRKETTNPADELTTVDKADDSETVCVWCRKSGQNQYIVKTTDGVKSFCTEVCFLQCRRASFKKSKICDWCKHVRHTAIYLEFQDGDSQLQFCTDKCLNQYKMSIFCKETQEHLSKLKPNGEDSETERERERGILITPDLWLMGEQLAKLKESKKTGDKVNAKMNVNKSPQVNNIDKNKKITDDKNSSELQKQSLIERIKAEANMKQKRQSLQTRKENERQAPSAASAAEPANSPRPGSLAHVSPQMYHSALAGMAPWIHQAQMLGTMGQALGPYGAFSSVMFPGLVPPYPPELMAEIAKAAEMGKDSSVSREKKIITEPGLVTVQHSPHSERSSTVSSARRAHLLEVPRPETTRNSPSPRTTVGSNNRQPSSLFPVDFPQMFSGQAFPGQAPTGFPTQPPQRIVGNGLPPVTMMVPFPVLLPLPVPIPVPIPLTMDTLIKHFQPKSQNTSEVNISSSESDKDCRPYSRENKSPRPAATVSPLSVSSNDELRYGNDTRSGSRNSCPDLHSSYNYVSPSLSDVSILKRSRTPDEVGSLDLSKRAKQSKFDSLTYESTNGAINLSTKYRGRSHASTENLSDDASSDEEDTDDKNSTRDSNDNLTDGSDTVPKIHIVTHTDTRPLNQHLPLPPTEQKYANRRGLILDAPSVPKKKRSPSPERPNYVRNIPRDLLEAARRRSLRATRNTIRTK